MKKSKFHIRLLGTLTIVGAGLLTLAGCSMENADDRQIATALKCIDTAASATDADVCMAKVQGIESSQAYLIRCSGNFIAQGLTGARLANAFQQQKSAKSGGSNATTAMAAYLVFAKNLPNHSADITLTNCEKSGVMSMIGLASMVSVATEIASFAGSIGATLDPANPSFDINAIKTNIATLVPANDASSMETKQNIGEAAISAQASYCASGSSLSTQDVCSKLNSAIAGGHGDPANIGQALLNLLNQ